MTRNVHAVARFIFHFFVFYKQLFLKTILADRHFLPVCQDKKNDLRTKTNLKENKFFRHSNVLSLRRTGGDLHVSLHKGFKVRLEGIIPVFIEFTG